MLAANLIALLLEPPGDEICEAALLEGLAAFELGRSENASAGAMKNALAYRALAAKTRGEKSALDKRVTGQGIKRLVEQSRALKFSGDPITDWRAVPRACRFTICLTTEATTNFSSKRLVIVMFAIYRVTLLLAFHQGVINVTTSRLWSVPQKVFGTNGDDELFGRSRGEWIFGLDGNDLINAGKGNDHVFGGKGNDALVGSEGNDYLFGGWGRDLLLGGAGLGW